jgi:hypothetical protein
VQQSSVDEQSPPLSEKVSDYYRVFAGQFTLRSAS